MTRTNILCSLVALGVLSIVGTSRLQAVRAQSQAAPAAVRVEKIKDNLYLLRGGGGNTAAFVTSKGVVLVDTMLPGWGRPILEAIKGFTTKPVVMIINTHTHRDHSGSNTEFGPNIDIVAHANTRASMEKPFCTLSVNCDAFKGKNKRYLPGRTFASELSIGSGADRIVLQYFGRAHTNGDIVVIFSGPRVAHVGDIFPFKQTPVIDAESGGSGVDYPNTVTAAARALQGKVDTLITGHSTLMSLEDLAQFAEFTREYLDWARESLKAGKSSIVAADEYVIPPKYLGYTVTAPTTKNTGVKNNLDVIYAELQR